MTAVPGAKDHMQMMGVAYTITWLSRRKRRQPRQQLQSDLWPSEPFDLVQYHVVRHQPRWTFFIFVRMKMSKRSREKTAGPYGWWHTWYIRQEQQVSDRMRKTSEPHIFFVHTFINNRDKLPNLFHGRTRTANLYFCLYLLCLINEVDKLIYNSPMSLYILAHLSCCTVSSVSIVLFSHYTSHRAFVFFLRFAVLIISAKWTKWMAEIMRSFVFVCLSVCVCVCAAAGHGS